FRREFVKPDPFRSLTETPLHLPRSASARSARVVARLSHVEGLRTRGVQTEYIGSGKIGVRSHGGQGGQSLDTVTGQEELDTESAALNLAELLFDGHGGGRAI